MSIIYRRHAHARHILFYTGRNKPSARLAIYAVTTFTRAASLLAAYYRRQSAAPLSYAASRSAGIKMIDFSTC